MPSTWSVTHPLRRDGTKFGLGLDAWITAEAAGYALVPMDYRGVLIQSNRFPISRRIVGNTSIEAFAGSPRRVNARTSRPAGKIHNGWARVVSRAFEAHKAHRYLAGISTRSILGNQQGPQFSIDGCAIDSNNLVAAANPGPRCW